MDGEQEDKAREIEEIKRRIEYLASTDTILASEGAPAASPKGFVSWDDDTLPRVNGELKIYRQRVDASGAESEDRDAS